MIDQDQINGYLAVVFGGHIPKTGWINLRGIGEKGTPQEGKFREDIFIDLATIEGDLEAVVDSVARHVGRWSEHGIASFIVPAILSKAKGEAQNVASFGSIVVDIDSGDVPAKIRELSNILGEPTAVVASGGTTAEGHKKKHLYWSLDQPCTDIPRLIKLRHRIGQGGGGDPMFGLGVATNPFGRAHQPVRIAGSIHNKNGKRSKVSIEPVGGKQYALESLEVLAEMLPQPQAPAEDPLMAEARASAALAMGEAKPKIDLTEKVHAGGEGANTRWSKFNQVAGFFIFCARKGDITMNDARNLARGWVEANMIPPWDEATFNAEFAGIANKDRAEKGEIPPQAKPQAGQEAVTRIDLEQFRADVQFAGEPPEFPFLVKDLIAAGKHQLFAAEGGAGKTFLFLDLGLQIASHTNENPSSWLGHPVKKGGTVIYITSEDDRDEMWRRLHSIDQQRKFMKTGNKLIVIPLIDAGGSFDLAYRDPKTGLSGPTPHWQMFLDVLAERDDLAAVMVDTMNSALHGAENDSVTIKEFVRELTKVVDRSGKKPAILVTHHVRKASDEPIRNADDMLAAIRGSSAITSAFRSVIGMWHCPDYDRRMTAMGVAPQRHMLYKMAICKANVSMFKGELTLLRQPSGLLANVTDQDRYSQNNFSEFNAWLLVAVERAAAEGHPYSLEGKNSKSGLYLRRNELPPIFSHTGPSEFSRLVDHMKMAGTLVATAARGGRDKKWLDVPGGPIAGDEAGAELNSGAYEPPNWRDWVYDPSNNSCHPKYK